MASYLDKAVINSAITDNTKLDLGHQHITTADFMQNNVSYIHELVPGSHIDVNMESFVRLNPLPVPTFGRASLRNRAFFVPFRTIFRGWNDFITDANHVYSDGKTNALIDKVPYVTNAQLVMVFANGTATEATYTENSIGYTLADQTAIAFDYYYSGQKCKLTDKGRQYLKIIEALGYKLSWDTSNLTEYSALPFLALAKIIGDYYYPSQYLSTNEYFALTKYCNYDTTSSPALTSVDIGYILDLASFVMYDSDYFVSAFDTPNQPVAFAHSDFTLVNIDSISSAYLRTSSSTTLLSSIQGQGAVTNYSGVPSALDISRQYQVDAPFINLNILGTNQSGTTNLGGVGGLSQYLLNGLHALTDYMKRHQLAGSRAMDRYLARFGKALSAEKLNRSIYLGAAIQDIQIGDVMSTSDTSGAQLGAYSGKGMSYGNGHFEFSTDEYGYFIILTSIVPAVGYTQGIDRQVMRLSKTQFWTPEFDSLGVQPLTANELYLSQNPLVIGYSQFNQDLNEQVFGYVPRYADYKVSHDQLTGNFRVPSINGTNPSVIAFNAADSWHLNRVFDDGDFGYDNNGVWTLSASYVVHSLNFLRGRDRSQYKRIFYSNPDIVDSPDNFTIIHNFEIAENAPMKALYDSYEFEDKGDKVTVDANGVKLN